MSTLTKRPAKKPAPKQASKAIKRTPVSRSPKPLAPGRPTAGFLAGTIKIGPAFDPEAPAFGSSEWRK